jgi:hypothetical protein
MVHQHVQHLFHHHFFLIQTVCVAYFTIEFLLQLISTPSYWKFLLSIFNWIDLGVIVPYYVLLTLTLIEKESNFNKSTLISLKILGILRFSRVFKIYLVFKQFKSLHVLSAIL